MSESIDTLWNTHLLWKDLKDENLSNKYLLKNIEGNLYSLIVDTFFYDQYRHHINTIVCEWDEFSHQIMKDETPESLRKSSIIHHKDEDLDRINLLKEGFEKSFNSFLELMF